MIKVFEMFSGYGGASFALKKANIPFECIGHSEIDKFAIQCYNLNFPNIRNFGDCTKINPNELPDFDLLTGGFPCQDVSIAGKRDLSKGRTNLYIEILRIAKAKKPKYMLLENVKGLLSIEVEDRKLVNIIVSDLQKIGYGVCWKILNSKDYGIPQNRERIWLVCKLGGWEFGEFQFPNKESLKIFVKDILEMEVDKKYNLSKKQIEAIAKRLRCERGMMIKGNISSTLSARDYKFGGKRIQFDVSGKGYNSEEDRAYNSEGVLCCIPNSHPQNKVNIFSLFPRNGNPNQGGTGQLVKSDGTSYCVDTGNCQAIELNIEEDNLIINSLMIFRRLTPKECFRLMGFLNDEINLDGISDTQQYKLAGNGWDINLVSKIFRQMFKKKGELELNKIYCEDALELLKKIPDNSVDLVLTDPPYELDWKQSIHFKNRKSMFHHKEETQKWDKGVKELYELIFKEFNRIIKFTGSVILFTRSEYITYAVDSSKKNGFDNKATIIWHKTNPMPQVRKKNYLSSVETILWVVRYNEKKCPFIFNFKTQNEMHNFIEMPLCGGNERTEHPTQKPLKLIKHLLEIHSNPDNLVLDCFAGSGTTAVACKQLGRKFIGCDISQEYVDIANKRLSQGVLNL